MAEDGRGQQMGHGQDSEGNRLLKLVFCLEKSKANKALSNTIFTTFAFTTFAKY